MIDQPTNDALDRLEATLMERIGWARQVGGLDELVIDLSGQLQAVRTLREKADKMQNTLERTGNASPLDYP